MHSAHVIAGLFAMLALVRAAWESRTDSEIVELVRDGDVDAFEVLVRRYQRRLHGVVFRMLHDREETADIVQDAFVRAYGALESFDTNRAFYTWLCRIAMNLAINLSDKKRRRATDSLDARNEEVGFEPADTADTAARAEQNDLTDAVESALEDLPEGMREVFVLRVYDELGYDEIAETLGIPVGTVMSRLSRARSRLQSQLKQFIDEEA